MISALEKALNRRRTFSNSDTTAFRWIDGEGDGFPNIEVEQLGANLLISSRSPHSYSSVSLIANHFSCATYERTLDPKEKTSPTHHSGPKVDQPFVVKENGVGLELSLQSGYSQGLFLDQRDNRSRLRAILEPGRTLLNTFAYTGAFSVFASLAGAETTTLDLSQPYLDWAKRNFRLNAIDPDAHHFIKGDTFHWLKRFAKQGRRFDAIVLDPPTFSRDAKGKVFRVQKDFGQLIELAERCLASDGIMLACTNCRQIDESAFIRGIRESLTRRAKLEAAPMPLDFTAPPYLKSIWIET